MALSGTLETFSLPDVLRLLASTKKTGLLALDGDRGTGRVWVADGEIVAAEADRSYVDDVDAVLFELLRFTDAAFEFEAGAEAAEPGEAREVDDALDVAHARLEEWRDIEAVVPSLDVRVRMVPEVDDDVQVRPAMWRILARVGTGASGHDVAVHLGQGEFDVCRSLRELVDAGLVEVGELDEEPHEPLAVADAFAAMVHAPDAEPEPVYEVVADAQPPGVQPAPFELAAEPASGFAPVTDAAEELAAIFGSPSAPAAVDDRAEDTREDTSEDTSELLSDLAHLSPKAAAAVEATWDADAPADAGDVHEAHEATTDAGPEHEAPSAGSAEGGEDLDQNLLLRFLSSAKH